LRRKKTSREKVRTISIPAELFKKIEERTKETEFTSVSDYVTYVLEEVLAESEEEEKPLTKEEEERIKARLKALGYLE